MSYINREELYEKTAEWEAQALHMVEKTMHDEDETDWKKWSVILKERSAFKFDVADMPAADVVERKTGKWIKNEELSSNHVEPIFLCSNCNNFEAWGFNECYPYCPNCGADMREVER